MATARVLTNLSNLTINNSRKALKHCCIRFPCPGASQATGPNEEHVSAPMPLADPRMTHRQQGVKTRKQPPRYPSLSLDLRAKRNRREDLRYES
jgi:hypothetical protein